MDFAAALDGAAGRVDLQVVNADERTFDLMAAANEGADASQQFLQLERLGHVVVGAKVEALDLVLHAAPRRQHEDVRAQTVLAPTLQQRQTVFLGQHDVEDDDVVLGGARLEIAFLTVGGDIDGEAFFFQPLPKGADKRFVIFDQQYAHDGFSLRGSPSRYSPGGASSV